MSATFIPVAQPSLNGNELKYVAEAVSSGWVSSLGPFLDAFEAAFARYCGVKHAVAVSNGTVALHLALLALDIKAGDEVIVPDLTFVATANAVRYLGGKPIFVDIEPDTLGMCPAALRSAITRRTRAIIPVHLFGHPADMDPILEIGRSNGVVVIEDAAEAVGARYKGVRVGSLADCATFSFYGNKIITCGEGGMLTTNSERVNERARLLRDHAMSKTQRYWHEEIGYNYRMTNVQAAIGMAQLEQIDTFLSRRKAIIDEYREGLGSIDGFRLTKVAPWAESSHWMACLEIDGTDRARRAAFMGRLREKGVDSRPYFFPMSSLPMYGGVAICPVAEAKSRIGINLPTYTELDPAGTARVIATIRKIVGEGFFSPGN